MLVLWPLCLDPCPLPRFAGVSRALRSAFGVPKMSGNSASASIFSSFAIRAASPMLGLRPPGSPSVSFGIRRMREMAGGSTLQAAARLVTVWPCCSIARTIGVLSTVVIWMRCDTSVKSSSLSSGSEWSLSLLLSSSPNFISSSSNTFWIIAQFLMRFGVWISYLSFWFSKTSCGLNMVGTSMVVPESVVHTT